MSNFVLLLYSGQAGAVETSGDVSSSSESDVSSSSERSSSHENSDGEDDTSEDGSDYEGDEFIFPCVSLSFLTPLLA